MNALKLLLGTDPELFAQTENGIITSVAGLLGCSKDNKLDLGNVRLQEDNVLVEFDTDPTDDFIGFNSLVLKGLEESAKAIKPLGYKLAEGVSSHIYTPDEIKGFAPSALEFGCSADFNGLTGERNPKPQSSDAGLRSAGGHIHFGFCPKVWVDEETQMLMTVMCDYYLGLASLMLDPDTRRRELYGKAGTIRYKEYGIEYRTLSNFWIFEEKKRRWAWEQSQKAYDFVKDRQNAMTLASMVSPNEIQRVINAGDLALAEQYIKMMEIM